MATVRRNLSVPVQKGSLLQSVLQSMTLAPLDLSIVEKLIWPTMGQLGSPIYEIEIFIIVD